MPPAFAFSFCEGLPVREAREGPCGPLSAGPAYDSAVGAELALSPAPALGTSSHSDPPTGGTARSRPRLARVLIYCGWRPSPAPTPPRSWATSTGFAGDVRMPQGEGGLSDGPMFKLRRSCRQGQTTLDG
jgi:hypothetical protein